MVASEETEDGMGETVTEGLECLPLTLLTLIEGGGFENLAPIEIAEAKAGEDSGDNPARSLMAGVMVVY